MADIYFTNAPTIEMALHGKTSLGALYHNNHDGTFTDVTQKAGLTKPCLAMGGAVGTTTTTGGPIFTLPASAATYSITIMATARSRMQRPKRGGGWPVVRGASFGDYDGDGFVDLMVSNYVDFHLDDLPQFGSKPYANTGESTCNAVHAD